MFLPIIAVVMKLRQFVTKDTNHNINPNCRIGITRARNNVPHMIYNLYLK